MMKIKMSLGTPTFKKYMLHWDGENKYHESKVYIYKRFLGVLWIKKYEFPLDEIDKAMEYLNYLDKK